jgi:hypothetical protein
LTLARARVNGDAPVNVKILVKMLGGLECITATNGVEAVEQVNNIIMSSCMYVWYIYIEYEYECVKFRYVSYHQMD